MRLLAAWVCSVVFLSSCAVLEGVLQTTFREPSLTFERVDVAEASLEDATLNVRFRIDNPNAVGLSLARADYKVSVEGHALASGNPPGGLQLPAGGAGEVTLPVHVRFADLGAALETFLQKDQAQYRVEGTLGVQTPLGPLNLPLSHQGTFEVPKVPALHLDSPRVGRIDFQGVELDFPLTLTNRNSFPLPVGGLVGAMAIDGLNVGELSSGDAGLLPPRGTRQLRLPLTIHLGAAAAAIRAVESGHAQVSFSGRLQSGGAQLPVRLDQALSFLR